MVLVINASDHCHNLSQSPISCNSQLTHQIVKFQDIYFIRSTSGVMYSLPCDTQKKKSSNNYPKTITPVNFAPCPLVYSKKFQKTKLEFESDSLILQGNDQTLTLLYYSYRIDEQKNDFGDIN